MLSHQLKKHVIDGEKAFILNPTEAQKLVLNNELVYDWKTNIMFTWSVSPLFDFSVALTLIYVQSYVILVM